MAWCSLSVLAKCKITLFFFCSIVCLSFSSALFAQEQEVATAGKAIMAQGEVEASSSEQARVLVRRSPVYAQDLVSTGQQSATQLRMIDGGLLSMQASSEVSISDYQFDTQTQQGNINMSLLKGGLKTITGALQQKPDNYQLMTPVASIGVRGTHYEAELIDGDLYLAGWKGIIDIAVTAGTLGQQFSLGPNMAYKFAIVRADGSVEFLLQTPLAFSQGYSRDLYQQSSEQFADIEYALLPQVTERAMDTIYLAKLNSQKYINNERVSASWLPSEVSRQGTVIFDQVDQLSVASSLGAISDFSMSMSINFDSASIPTGNLAFSDQGGEWFAAFNGIINQQVLDLSVNFASHNNNLATGIVEGVLIDQSRGVLGNISLRELAGNGAEASGSFLLRQAKP
jgi:hypothetical protein